MNSDSTHRRRLFAAAAFVAVAAASGSAMAQVNSGKGLTGLWLLDQNVYDHQGAANRDPPLKPEAKAIAEKQRRAVEEGGEVLSDNGKKCLPSGMPGIVTNEFALEFLETPGVVTVVSENSPLSRTISLTRKAHNTDQEPGWVGDSIGHWDKGVLVVETTNLNDRVSHIPRSGGVKSLTTKITERYHLEKGGELLVNDMTFEDPTLLSRPWTVRYVYHRGERDAQLWEYVCEVGAAGWSERFQGDPAFKKSAQ